MNFLSEAWNKADPLAILEAARAKIADPDNWVKGHNARDADDNRVSPESDEACKFCASGAIKAARHDLRETCRSSPGTNTYAQSANARILLGQALTNRSYIPSSIAGRCIIKFNDWPDTTHADVMKAFDKAIALAKKDFSRADASQVQSSPPTP